MTDFVWTDDAVAALRALLDMGASRREAAFTLSEAYGVTFSRNTIVGKAFRLGIRAPARPPKPPKPPSIHAPRGPRGLYKVKAKPPMPLPPSETMGWRPIGIMELENNSCRWMTGEAVYCGDPTADLLERRPYCAHHHAIAYREPTRNLGRLALAPYVLRP